VHATNRLLKALGLFSIGIIYVRLTLLAVESLFQGILSQLVRNFTITRCLWRVEANEVKHTSAFLTADEIAVTATGVAVVIPSIL
jgi:hypothetical protein